VTLIRPRGVGITPQMFPGFIENLHAGVGSHVQSSLGIDHRPVAIAARRKRGEIAAVGEHSRSLHVESDKRAAIGDIESLVVRAEDDTVVRNPPRPP